ncbi:MAG TPA: sugar phosphate isomerase/epimerase family protein [Chloroflexota bacterium]|nr:sugar phosphate isomerase/epimerase family protein [Chloroflexota bacterium]
MRLANSGALYPHHVDEFTEGMAIKTRELGFTGIFTRFDQDDPFAVSDDQCRRVRDILADSDLQMVQAIGYRPPLIHTDESIRREAVRTLREGIRIAAALGSQSCHTGPGSMNQLGETHADWGGAWTPHPANWSSACRDQLVKSLKEIARTAEDHGVVLGLEGHVLVALNSAETMRAVLDEVGSPAVKCDLDPVNWLTLDSVYQSGPAIERMLATLGDHIFNAHAKDVVVEPRLVIHIDERPAGQGLLDFDPFMRGMEALGSDRYLVIEHAEIDDIPAAKAFLERKAVELGIRIF